MPTFPSLSLREFPKLSTLLVFLFVIGLGACVPNDPASNNLRRAPELTDSAFITADNVSLPVRVWDADVESPRAVIIGLHGFNDYANAFRDLGTYLASNHRIFTYAYDQRGFGDTEGRGTWAGVDTYVQDLRDFTAAVRARFPEVPIYVMGESMGGAVAMVAFSSDEHPVADGVILSAPAVWARRTMPWYQRAALYVARHVMPKASFSGKGLGVKPSDNREMLIALGRDPKVIKKTTVAAMNGLTNLMDAALYNAHRFDANALIMIGELDEVVPNHASARMLTKLRDEPTSERTVAIYDQGYHMLFRDMNRQLVWDDISAWIDDASQPLPSGSDQKPVTKWIQANL